MTLVSTCEAVLTDFEHGQCAATAGEVHCDGATPFFYPKLDACMACPPPNVEYSFDDESVQITFVGEGVVVPQAGGSRPTRRRPAGA